MLLFTYIKSPKLLDITDDCHPEKIPMSSSSNAVPYPSNGHIKTAQRTLRYLKSRSYASFRRKRSYCDASQITSGKSKSRCGALYLGLDSGAFWSMSKNATTISLSSCESEIKAMTLVACAIIHERDKLKAIDFEQVKPTILYTDSQSSLDLCKTLRYKENTKHINVRINFRECVNNRIIEIVFIKTDRIVG
jgi:hypothetical protein